MQKSAYLDFLLERKGWNRTGDGVCIYIRNNIAYSRQTDLDNDLEAVFVDILLPKTKSILVGTVDRPPHQEQFYDDLEETLTNSPKYCSQETYVMGDLNTDVS